MSPVDKNNLEKMYDLAFMYFKECGNDGVEERQITQEVLDSFLDGWSSDSRGIQKAVDALLEDIEDLFWREIKGECDADSS